jgi:hypothetical protein
LSGGANGGQAGSSIEFSAPGINFRSAAVDSMSMQGGQASFSGTGSVNGTGGYHFTLDATAGGTSAGNAGLVRMRIWHLGPDSKTEIVDYDNLVRSGSGYTGTAVVDGAIPVEPD